MVKAHAFFMRLCDIADDWQTGKITEAERKDQAAALWAEIKAAGVETKVRGFMKGG